jgi:excisionase family DNA binding protein
MDKLLLRPTEAAEAIGIGRSKVYELLASGELPSIRIGSSVRVPVDALREWIARRLEGKRP